SLKHEDFLGKVSQMPLTRDQMRQTIAMAKSILESMLECKVSGFRAPYTRINGDVIATLAELGFAYDSSETRAIGPDWRLESYLVEGGDTFLAELALPEFKDSRGKRMTSYLWPMLEGRRRPEEYLDVIRQTAPTAPGGLFILAFHPWHIAADEKGRPFSPEELQRNCRDLGAVLAGLRSIPATKLVTLQGYLNLVENA
ncbi:MAG: hypothetical protein FJ278_22250, partial [Planctomycetes bacterium]|nr:hypothetical protein [Planctomycetota bacterium]